MTKRPEDPEETPLDAHLRAALRHAPDHDAAPPAALSASILAAAAQAVREPLVPEPAEGMGALAARRSGVAAQLLAWLDGLQRPAVAGAFASLVLATVLVVVWRNAAVPGAAPERRSEVQPRHAAPADAASPRGAVGPLPPAVVARQAAPGAHPPALPAAPHTAPTAVAPPPADVSIARRDAPSPGPREAKLPGERGEAEALPEPSTGVAAEAAAPSSTPETLATSPLPAPTAVMPSTAISPDAVLADAAPLPAAANAAPMATLPPAAAPAATGALAAAIGGAATRPTAPPAAPNTPAAVAPNTTSTTSTTATAGTPAPSPPTAADPLAAALTAYGYSAAAARARSGTDILVPSAAEGSEAVTSAWLNEVRDAARGRWQPAPAGSSAPTRALKGPDGRLLGRIELVGPELLWQGGEGGPAWQASLPPAAAARLAQQLETSRSAP